MWLIIMDTLEMTEEQYFSSIRTINRASHHLKRKKNKGGLFSKKVLDEQKMFKENLKAIKRLITKPRPQYKGQRNKPKTLGWVLKSFFFFLTKPSRFFFLFLPIELPNFSKVLHHNTHFLSPGHCKCTKRSPVRAVG